MTNDKQEGAMEVLRQLAEKGITKKQAVAALIELGNHSADAQDIVQCQTGGSDVVMLSVDKDESKEAFKRRAIEAMRKKGLIE
ncbi:MAG: hypothetical protein AB8F34_14140 [Akkermansiaceae bacterium]